MFRKLLLSKKVKVVDGDNRIGASSGEIKDSLISLVNNGLTLRVIQLFHYAAIHYNTRWDNYPMRFLNALLNSASTIEDGEENLILNGNEEPELQGDSSEVLGIGLSNMFMCRWYGVNINRIEKIPGSKKRCDYRFGYKSKVIVFESKGRGNASQINSALKDCLIKKAGYSGSVKYSTICHLPRNGTPVSIHLYDPPINEEGLDYNEVYALVNHYKRITQRVGLTELSRFIGERIDKYDETGEWENGYLGDSNVMKIGFGFTYRGHSYWTKYSNNNYGREENLYISLGIEWKVIELLERWDLTGLKNINYEEHVHEDFSFLADGSFLYIGSENLSTKREKVL